LDGTDLSENLTLFASISRLSLGRPQGGFAKSLLSLARNNLAF
jgi:hypothetical protein